METKVTKSYFYRTSDPFVYQKIPVMTLTNMKVAWFILLDGEVQQTLLEKHQM